MAKKDADLSLKVKDIFGALFPHWEGEEILMHPREEGRYFVAMVNHRLKMEMDSHTIMSLLLGGRKDHGRTRHPVKLQDELDALKMSQTYDEFRTRLAEEFVEYCEIHLGEGATDRLFRRFDESIKFCDLVRDRLKAPHLPDMVIIRTLLNIRKSPKARRVTS